MKKRTLGRIAAVGLAGLTAVPAMAMVASADITYSGRPDANGKYAISGTASYVEWLVVKTTTTYDPQNFIVGNDTVGYTYLGASGRTSIVTQNLDKPTSTIVTGPGNGRGYYATAAQAKMAYSLTDAEMDVANKTAATTKTTFEKKCKAYVDYKNAFNDVNKSNIAITRSFTDADGQSITIYKEAADVNTIKYKINNVDSPIYPEVKMPEVEPIDTYAYAPGMTPSPKSVSMKDLATAVGGITVSVDAYGEIKPNASGLYVLNTSSSSGSTGTVGSYGAYEIPAGYRYASSVSYFSNVTGSYYPNLAALYAAAGTGTSYSTKIPSPAYSTTYCYFDPVNGNYITSSQYTNGYYPYAVYVSAGTVTSNTENAIYYVNGLYYYTWSSAYSAAGNDASKVQYIRDYSSLGNYFSRTTGQFYSTYESALSASGGISSRVVALNGSYYDGYYDYLDPYYLYFMNMGGTSSNNSSSLGGSSVKIGNRSGWANVRSQIRSARSGAALDVSLNGEVVIPEEILSALAGKNVTVNFKLPNGAVVSYNGQNISGVKDVNVAVQYNTKNVPSGLVKKATSVNNSLSTSQISVSSNTLAGSASVTVKYSTNRAGCTAKIYRYNASRNSLQLVDTSTVASNGKVTFDGMKQGGDFVIVLFN